MHTSYSKIYDDHSNTYMIVSRFRDIGKDLNLKDPMCCEKYSNYMKVMKDYKSQTLKNHDVPIYYYNSNCDDKIIKSLNMFR